MINTLRIKGRMAELGITQRVLAEALNLSQSTVSLKLKGRRPMLLGEAERIAEKLSIDDADFGRYFFDREIA